MFIWLGRHWMPYSFQLPGVPDLHLIVQDPFCGLAILCYSWPCTPVILDTSLFSECGATFHDLPWPLSLPSLYPLLSQVPVSILCRENNYFLFIFLSISSGGASRPANPESYLLHFLWPQDPSHILIQCLIIMRYLFICLVSPFKLMTLQRYILWLNHLCAWLFAGILLRVSCHIWVLINLLFYFFWFVYQYTFSSA